MNKYEQNIKQYEHRSTNINKYEQINKTNNK